jgi:hypothetical protein
VRHQWDEPRQSFERTCKRCGAVLRKYPGQGEYQFWPDGLDGQARPMHVQRIPECEARRD